MLMTYQTFKRTLPRTRAWMALRLLSYLIAAPFALSLAYALLMLGISAMWWVGNQLGDDGHSLPYTCSALAFLLIAVSAEVMVKRKQYCRYLAASPTAKLLEIIESPAGLYKGWEKRAAINVLHQMDMSNAS